MGELTARVRRRTGTLERKDQDLIVVSKGSASPSRNQLWGEVRRAIPGEIPA